MKRVRGRQIASVIVAATLAGSLAPRTAVTQHLLTGRTTTTANTLPVVDLNGTDSGIDRTAIFTAGAGAVLVADTDAMVADVDGRYLLAATVQITNTPNGASEVLAANVGGTGLTATLSAAGASRTLTITGLATEATYEQVLRGVTYNNTAPSVNTSPRTIVVRVSDGQLQSESARATLFVNTPGPCSITCPSSVSAATEAGRCDANVSFNPPVTTGTCGAVNVSHASGSVFPRGLTTVTASSPSSGASCSFTVTVNDTAGPSMSCPGPITVANAPGQCGAAVNFEVTATDNCPGVNSSADPPSGSIFPVGTTNVTAGANDTSGNINFCIFSVTVNDAQPPDVTCPGNITVQAPPGAESVAVNFETSATDNCAGVNAQADPPSGSSFPVGTTAVTTTATDAKGNTSSCSFSVTVLPAPTPTPTPTPTAAPTPPSRFANISTRLRVEAGDNVLIGGFIVTGSTQKRIIVRALGPSLPVDDHLTDPLLDLYNGSGDLLASNDNWQDAPNAQEIIDSTIPPANDKESAILRDVDLGPHTAVVSGVNGGTGVGLVEIYDLGGGQDSRLANISTRGRVLTGDDVMIGGLIITGSSAQRVILRAIGPSLDIVGRLEDPLLELFDSEGNPIASNDNWKDLQQDEIEATQIPPSNDLEAAIVTSLIPAPYTALVRGVDGTTGLALVEVYALD